MNDSEWYERSRLVSYHDAGPVAAAKRWLGKRYLLAKDINKRKRK